MVWGAFVVMAVGTGPVVLTHSGVPLVRPFHPFSICVSFPNGSEYAVFCYKYVDLLSVNRPIFSGTVIFLPIEVHVEREGLMALSSCATSRFMEATVEVSVADGSSGADSIPKSSQAVR